MIDSGLLIEQVFHSIKILLTPGLAAVVSIVLHYINES